MVGMDLVLIDMEVVKMNKPIPPKKPIPPPSQLIKDGYDPIDKPANYTLRILSSNYRTSTNRCNPKRRYRIIKNGRDFYIIERLVLGLFWIGLLHNDKLDLIPGFGPVEYISVEKAEEAIIRFNKNYIEKHPVNKREIIKEITF